MKATYKGKDETNNYWSSALTATYKGKDDNQQDENIIYWFDVQGYDYGVVEGRTPGIVDDEGVPVKGGYYESRLEAALKNAVTDQMRAE